MKKSSFERFREEADRVSKELDEKIAEDKKNGINNKKIILDFINVDAILNNKN